MINLFFEVQVAFAVDYPLPKSNAFPSPQVVTTMVTDQQRLEGSVDDEGKREMEDVKIPDWLEGFKLQVKEVKVLRSYPRRANQDTDEKESSEQIPSV